VSGFLQSAKGHITDLIISLINKKSLCIIFCQESALAEAMSELIDTSATSHKRSLSF
jgi:hypothetical protein